MAKTTHRAAARVAGGCAFILAVSLSGCATPQYAEVSVPRANFHFQIPRGWDQISGPSLASQLRAGGYDTGGVWIAGYDAGPEPRAADYRSSGRQNAVAHGFPFTRFSQIRDQLLPLGRGAYGVRETYDYTFSGHADTFDEDVITNADRSGIFLLVVHCVTTCYSSYRTEIDYVMSSVSPA